MAHVFANRKAIGPEQDELLGALLALPENFWVLGPVQLWRRVDWLVLRTEPFSHVFTITVAATNRPLRGFSASEWEWLDADANWHHYPPEIPQDVNPLGQALASADAALLNLRERGLLPEGGSITPVLFVASTQRLNHQLPGWSVDGRAHVFSSAEDAISHLRRFDPGPDTQIPIGVPLAQRLVDSLSRPNQLAPYVGVAPKRRRRLLPPNASRWAFAAAMGALALQLGVNYGRPAMQRLVGSSSPIGSALGDEPAPHCGITQRPVFSRGLADLKAALGDRMGEPIECEHANTIGDVEQRTSTGLAFYRPRSNMPGFTTGTESWGLTDRGLLYWRTASFEPPPNAEVVPR